MLIYAKFFILITFYFFRCRKKSFVMDSIERKYFLINDKVLSTSEFVPEIINYGTTIYEMVKIINCVPVFWEKYLNRINNSLRLIKREIWFNGQDLADKISYLNALNCVKDTGHLKILISFENEFYGYPQDLLIMYFAQAPVPTPGQYEKGVKTVTLNAQRTNPNAKVFLPELRQQAQSLIEKYGLYEVILLTQDNYITEGSRSNVFFVKDNALYTANLYDVLPGITRNNVIEIARSNGIQVYETKIHYDQLRGFDAAFLTGTSRKIVPIRSIDGFEFDAQNPLIRKLMRLYDEKINQYVAKNKDQWQCPGC